MLAHEVFMPVCSAKDRLAQPARQRIYGAKRPVVCALRVGFVLLAAVLIAGCATTRSEKSTMTPGKYRGDTEEMMPSSYTPRDDGIPLTSNELYAFRTVSDLDRNLSEADARIVELHFKTFIHEKRGTFGRFLDRSSRFLPHVRQTFSQRGIPEDVAYLFMVESGGNTNAISPAGAAGMWQFMPFTGRKFGLKQDNYVDERRDPYKATSAAADYLLMLYNMFSDWHLAVAAYNAGEGKIGKAITGTGAKDFFELCRLDVQLVERERLKDETRDYVPRLIAFAKIMRNLNRLGFSEPRPEMAWNLVPISVPPNTNLTGLAQKIGLSWDEFSGMNPAFRRSASHPGRTTTAYVPPEKAAEASSWVASSDARVKGTWKEYKIRKGDSLSSIASRNGVSVAAIREANGFRNLPKPGTVIVIPGGTARAASGGAPSGSYVVQPGDTLSALARNWGCSVDSIRNANGMGPKETSLRLGQRLHVPGSSTRQSAPAAPAARSAAPAAATQAPRAAGVVSGASYIVQPGDTVSAIAVASGVSSKTICEANGLDIKKPIIKPGQRLVIPGAAAVQKAPATSGAAQPSSGTVKPASASAKPASAPAKPASAPAKPAAAPAKSASSKTVTVKAGDSLFGIAKANKVSVDDLRKANNLGSSNAIKPGQKLRIP